MAKVGTGGSGTCIGYDREAGTALVLTCHHVVQATGAKPTITFPGGGRSYAGELLASDADSDLAAVLIRVAEAVPSTSVAEDDPPIGGTLWRVGYAGGRLGITSGPRIATMLGGAITVPVDPDASRWVACAHYGLFVRLSIRPGDSGGGVFDAQGRLVGVAAAYVVQDPSIGLCCGPGPIRRFLQKVQWRKPQPRPSPPSPPSPPIAVPPPMPAPPIAGTPGRDGAPGPAGPPGPPGGSPDLAAIRLALDAIRADLGRLRETAATKTEVDALRGDIGRLKESSATRLEIDGLRAEVARLKGTVGNLGGSIRVRVEPK